ncbi:MAG: AGE family epimerase/isomerase [Armatimonadetes bacterium]|nr:AGE family epimerase/isomerase [Armatimonadota bacterium]
MSTLGEDRIPDLRDHALTCVLPFWERYGIDRDHGGFITHLARDGRITDASQKFLVGQTRMIYSFAIGTELGGPPEWLTMADQGVDFLLRHFRDFEHDGWFWSTSLEGRPEGERGRGLSWGGSYPYRRLASRKAKHGWGNLDRE